MRRPGWPTVFFNPGWIGLSHPYVLYKGGWRLDEAAQGPSVPPVRNTSAAMQSPRARADSSRFSVAFYLRQSLPKSNVLVEAMPLGKLN